MRTLDSCKLAISNLPWFSYDASTGGGVGTASASREPGRLNILFRPEDLVIPPLNRKTTKVSGWLPLPPLIEINIMPQVLPFIKDSVTLSSIDLRANSNVSFTP